MAIEKLFDDKEVSRRELAMSDYQVICEVEKLLLQLKQLLDDNGVDTGDVELAKIDDKRRDAVRARIKAR